MKAYLTTTARTTIRHSTPAMQTILLIAGFLVFVSGVQLFVLTDFTADYFAWTIKPPLTAAFLGAAYWSSCVLELFAARKRLWSETRIAIPAVLIFTALTLIVTLVHLDRFHFNRPELLPRLAAWVWLIIYAIVPPLLAVVLWAQIREPGQDQPRTALLPWWVRAILLMHAIVMGVFGIALLLVPLAVAPIWPWEITPLTGRAIGAWLFALGFAAAQAAYENDWGRVQVATMTYILFASLELVALARYPNDIFWDQPTIWVMIGILLSMLFGGLYGWFQAARHMRVE
jgi:hypothetical protein